MKYCTTGDFLIHATIPEEHAGIKKIAEFIGQADVRITNLETTVTDGTCWASAYFCDTALTAKPEILDELKKFGFQACGCCNNHSLDFGTDGLIQTLDYLDRAGIKHAGTGRNMTEASAPVIIETEKGCVGYIALGSMCVENESGRAGYSHDGIPARPGVNCMRHIDESLVTQEQMDYIKALAKDTMVNAAEDLEIAYGYGHLDDGTFSYGLAKFRVAEKTGHFSRCNPTDMKRTEDGIRNAVKEKGHVVVSLHTHQFKARTEDEPDYYAEEFARRCIDAGAESVFMTGNHLLKGIEIYKDSPIFYGLGNFFFQPDYVTEASADLCEALGFSLELTGPQIVEKRLEKSTASMETGQIFYLSVIPQWTMENGKITSMKLMPIELGIKEPMGLKGIPSPCAPEMVFDELQRVCDPYGTELKINGELIELVIK